MLRAALLFLVFAPLALLAQEPLAPPGSINIGASIRSQSLSSAVGRIELRWPRSAEKLFGRTPERAMVEAALSVSRALKQSSFPYRLQVFDQTWHVVFMDSELPEQQIPQFLRQSCHPGWMTPPANIYIVAQRVAGNCGRGQASPSQVADVELTRVLLHEMGHVLEHSLMDGNNRLDRMRSEGFAAWFEQYSSGFSSLMAKGSILAGQRGAVRAAGVGDPFDFDGSPVAYARAACVFDVLASRRGVQGLMDLYALMSNEGLSLEAATEKIMGWDRKQVIHQVSRRISDS